MRSTALAAMVGVVMMGSVAAAQGGKSPAPTVQLLVFNPAKIRPELLSSAEEVATSIYREAGVEATWLNDPVSSSDGRPAYLTLNIVSGDQTRHMAAGARLRDFVMGFAPRTSTSNAVCSRVAYVFVDRIEASATKHHVAIDRLLGRVMAHEAGHLLLPFNSHSDQGLMRTNWDPECELLEYFTQAQAEIIRQRVVALNRRPQMENPD